MSLEQNFSLSLVSSANELLVIKPQTLITLMALETENGNPLVILDEDDLTEEQQYILGNKKYDTEMYINILNYYLEDFQQINNYKLNNFIVSQLQPIPKSSDYTISDLEDIEILKKAVNTYNIGIPDKFISALRTYFTTDEDIVGLEMLNYVDDLWDKLNDILFQDQHTNLKPILTYNAWF